MLLKDLKKKVNKWTVKFLTMNKGNRFFQNKEYTKADIEYQKALIQFDYTFADTPEEDREAEKLQEQCHTNMALVKFYQKDYKECISQCSLVRGRLWMKRE